MFIFLFIFKNSSIHSSGSPTKEKTHLFGFSCEIRIEVSCAGIWQCELSGSTTRWSCFWQPWALELQGEYENAITGEHLKRVSVAVEVPSVTLNAGKAQEVCGGNRGVWCGASDARSWDLSTPGHTTRACFTPLRAQCWTEPYYRRLLQMVNKYLKYNKRCTCLTHPNRAPVQDNRNKLYGGKKRDSKLQTTFYWNMCLVLILMKTWRSKRCAFNK